jgi:hypothetical protein
VIGDPDKSGLVAYDSVEEFLKAAGA